MKRPTITKPRLLWRKDKKGQWKPYHRTQWTDGGKRRCREVLLDWQGDAQKLDLEYWRCEAGRHTKQKRPQKYTWADLVAAWRSDPREQNRLSQGTLDGYNRGLEVHAFRPAFNSLAKSTHSDRARTTHE